MPKINFNVPFINELGEPVQQTKTDPKKTKVDAASGRQIPHIVTNDDGTVMMETVMVKDQLVKILTMPFEGDEKLPFGDRVKRGKLARKVMTSSTANYRTEELTTIKELSARIGSVTLLTQLDALIEGNEPESDGEGNAGGAPEETNGKGGGGE